MFNFIKLIFTPFSKTQNKLINFLIQLCYTLSLDMQI